MHPQALALMLLLQEKNQKPHQLKMKILNNRLSATMENKAAEMNIP
jgi:hypothetical protein